MAILRTRLAPPGGAPLFLAPTPKRPAAPVRTVSFLARAQLLYPLAVPAGVLFLALVPPVGVGAWNGAVLGTAIGRVLFLYPWVFLAFLATVFLLVGAWQRWRSRRHPLDPILAVWRSQVADPEDRTACLPGSRVWGPVRRHEWGWELDGDGAGTNQHNGRVEANLPGIAAAYRQPVEAFRVVPRTGNGGFTLVFTDPAWQAERDREEQERRTRPVLWTAPTLDPAAGTIAPGEVVGTHAPALLDLWTPGWGARHMWLLGDTGSGKTYFLDNVLLDACSAGLWVPHIIDLEDGPTLAGWERFAASYAVTLEQANETWEALHAEHDVRKPLVKQLGGDSDVLEPSRENPGHLVVVDGGPRAVRDRTFMEHLRRAAYEWRKFCMKVIWVSQPGTADQAFGSSELGGTQLRNQFKDRVGFRAGKESSDAMFGDQRLLPSIGEHTPGVAYVQSSRFPEPTLIRGKLQHDRAGLRGKYLDIPAWSRPNGSQPPAWGPQRAEPLAVVREMPRSNRDAVLGALRSLGSAPSSEVIEVSGVPQASAYREFGRLVDEGLAVSPSRGVWAMREQQ